MIDRNLSSTLYYCTEFEWIGRRGPAGEASEASEARARAR